MIAYDVGKWLDGLGFGTWNTDLFLNFQPDSPDNCITIYDVNAPIIDESNCLSVDNFGIQILVRNTVSETAKTLLKNINKKIIGFSGYFYGTTNFVSNVNIGTNPAGIGKDQSNRQEYSAIYYCRVESIGDLTRL